jgi:hypothetical protein
MVSLSRLGVIDKYGIVPQVAPAAATPPRAQ